MPGKVESNSPGHGLYKKAARSAKKLAIKQAAAPEGCTFEPKMVKTPTARKLREKAGKDLYLAAQEREARLKKRIQDEFTNPEGCTFSPKITARARQTGSASANRSEKLYASAATTAKKSYEREASREGRGRVHVSSQDN